jgi:DNA-binding response OmpR family regulator
MLGLMDEAGRRRPAAEVTPATVLLVEDDPSLRTIVRRNLEARGYRVVAAETAAEALAAVEAGEPAVMLLDINLPDGSGWDVLRALGACGRQVPTVVLTAVPASRARLGEFRPAAYLPKPFPLEALLATVERLTHASSVTE